MLINRRIVLKTAVASAAAVLNSLPLRAAPETFALRSIPSTGETLPVVGLGSWITFNVGDDQLLLDECAAVIDAFFAGGGKLIDSSPMYGSSQSTIGYGLKKHRHRDDVFSADKVWTSYPDAGPEQISRTRGEWGVKRFDLMQVHNLLEWKSHLETLRAMKARGELRYIGVTTSHGRRHDILERIMNTEEIDFVQVTYNILDREVEKRILPLARERGIGVIINRPYQRGFLIKRFASEELPKWLPETGASSWPQFLLKFIISHPAVTCAIPATTRIEHVRENLAAATGNLPDANLRRRMADYVRQL